MKRIIVLIACILLSGVLKAQTEQITILQASAAANVNSATPTSVISTSSELDVMVWSAADTVSVSRTYLQFDLSQLPANAIVDSAYISLYADASAGSGNTGSPTYGTNNTCSIYQVTSSWSASAITWNTQPTYTTANSVTLQQSTAANEDYMGIEVGALIRNMSSGNNYGFLIKMQQETMVSNSMIFYSPSSTAAGKQPMLAVCYHIP